LLKVAVTVVLAQTPVAQLGGATEITVGGVTVEFVPVLSGSLLHPAAKTSSRNAVKQIP
jgi:hypothetical protein